MRHMILMRGAPGAGKSTFINEKGLAPFTISPDDFRLRLGGITLNESGDLTLNHAFEKRVWQDVEDALDFKMEQGQLVVVDATFQQKRDFSMPLKLAERHRYHVHCVDFTSLAKETALQRNQQRQAWKVVPEDVIHRAYERFADHAIPRDIEVWPFDGFGGGESPLDRLESERREFSDYEAVVHIGDLQGCYEPVAKLFSDGWRDDHAYIFVGDLLDRGIQNGEVIRFTVDEILPRDNAFLIMGNHELHIHRFAKNQPARSKEFQLNTLPQIESAKFTRKEANMLLDKAQDVLAYTYRDRRVLVTHAGLARVPEQFVTLPSVLFWKGTGVYSDPVDERFAENMAGTNWIQVHGHRNQAELPVQAFEKSYNLEGQVEFGGHLRVMELIGEGQSSRIATREILNTLYRKAKSLSVQTSGGTDASDFGKLSEELLAELQKHPLVQEKRFETQPHLRSINFTRKAFYDGKWDDVNRVARGLFIADDRRIVARSYPKFFNHEERAETQDRNLMHRLSFPLKLWVKENGYLGILGWDHMEDTPFFASKSTPESDFAQWFKEIFTGEVGEQGIRYAGEIVKNRNLSLVFEVNDPVRDPHMIEYGAPHVVLLDAIHRTEDFRKLDYAELEQIASALGIKVKQPGPTFASWKDFSGWMKAVKAQGSYYKWNDAHIEGFVCEDADGFQFKIKLDFYAFWKRMRGLRDKVRRARERQTAVDANPGNEEGRAFLDWLMTQPDSALQDSIIDLRNRYFSARGEG